MTGWPIGVLQRQISVTNVGRPPHITPALTCQAYVSTRRLCSQFCSTLRAAAGVVGLDRVAKCQISGETHRRNLVGLRIGGLVNRLRKACPSGSARAKIRIQTTCTSHSAGQALALCACTNQVNLVKVKGCTETLKLDKGAPARWSGECTKHPCIHQDRCSAIELARSLHVDLNSVPLCCKLVFVYKLV